ncbi:MAG TPA: glycoside hydrolase family 99 protein [Candidatus Brocadiia bacterium]|nr:glycoside hydrolase family 99 protein [Candidatus Brocadiia bacterium]
MNDDYSKVHAFYYPWYGNPKTDGAWAHWNHNVILHEGGGKAYNPPDDIGANFYPQIGCYSSMSRADLDVQMRQMRDAGIGVIALSWWGADRQEDKTVPLTLDVADKYGLKVCFHIEPYGGRNAVSFKETIKYLVDKYGCHNAFYRDKERGNRPLFYLYDSYLVPAEEWATVLSPDASNTIRGTQYDAVVIALWVKSGDGGFVLKGCFDGFYTYFATDGFTYGSTYANWQSMSRWAKEHGKIFIPSVGPGYDDTRIRPWNAVNRRDREGGAYYDRMFQAALDAKPDFVSVTSFNEWHEGTQIEPAVPKTITDYKYVDYSPREPDYYLKRTRHWADRFLDSQNAGR